VEAQIEVEEVSTTEEVTRVVEADMRVEGDMVEGADTVEVEEGDINIKEVEEETSIVH